MVVQHVCFIPYIFHNKLHKAARIVYIGRVEYFFLHDVDIGCNVQILSLLVCHSVYSYYKHGCHSWDNAHACHADNEALCAKARFARSSPKELTYVDIHSFQVLAWHILTFSYLIIGMLAIVNCLQQPDTLLHFWKQENAHRKRRKTEGLKHGCQS